MSNLRHHELRRVFDAALALPASERAAFVARECSADPALRARIEELLVAGEDERFLSTPEQAAVPSRAVAAIPHEGPGTRIGPYELVRQIGEGGFGAVFLAEQRQPVARTVALKILKLGMDTVQVVARFEQERQALARMDHPHIARVIDAGATALGRPYFVMEFVDGLPIVEYCDREHLSVPERLALFAQVCDAVQHAHGRGIIHRDLKPSNVLVASLDGRPHCKVIDFGIAKAIAQKLTDRTLFTEARQIVGTLLYMSPEQAAGAPDLDIRTDVYSLGVLLYELLTGTTPLDAATVQVGWQDELQRLLREQEAPRPSIRLTGARERAEVLAAQRRTTVHRLQAELRGELDWIVMKALEKEPDRRYGTASGLADDVRRHLAGEPVLAAPPGAGYRLRKFVRRHRLPVAAGVALVLALAGGVAAFAWQAAIAGAERDRAVLAGEQARQIQQFVLDALGTADPFGGGEQGMLVVEAMARAGELLDAGSIQQPAVELELRLAIAEIETDNGAAATALQHAERALVLARALFPGDHERIVQALATLAHAQAEAGRPVIAEPLRGEALAMARRLFPGDHQMLVQLLHQHAIALGDVGRAADAEPLLRDSLAMARRVFPGDHWFVASLQNAIGQQHWAAGREHLAAPLLGEAVGMARRLSPGDHPKTARFLANQGMVLSLVQPAIAVPLLEEALAMTARIFPGDHQDVVGRRTQLGGVLRDVGRFAEALQQFEPALAMCRRLWPGDHPRTALCLGQLAALHAAQGAAATAEPLYEEALAMWRRLHPGDHPEVAKMLGELATVRQAQGRLEGVEAAFQAALAMVRRLHTGDHDDVRARLRDLGFHYWTTRRPADAEQCFAEAAAICRRLHPGDHMAVADALDDLGSALLAQGDHDAAEPILREALAIGRRLAPADVVLQVRLSLKLAQGAAARGLQGPLDAALADVVASCRRGTPGDAAALQRSLRAQGLLHLQAQRAAIARLLLTEALALSRQRFPGGHADTVQVLEEYAAALGASADQAAAEVVLAEALAMARSVSGVDPGVAPRLTGKLAACRTQLGK